MKATDRARGIGTGGGIAAATPLLGLLGLLATLSSTGCGHSIQAVYEADVRFEHCMAMDARPAVKARIRKQCWKEWLAFYTYGQTRDRVLHAQLRVQQLDGSTRLPPNGSGPATSSVDPLEGPGPTTALSPPPMYDTAPSTFTPVEGGGPETDRCLGECQAGRDACTTECVSPACRKSCSVRYRSCMKRCG